MRRYEVGTAVVIMLIAAIAMFDTRRGALPDPTGAAPGGLAGGFYPFWSAAFMLVSAALLVARGLSTPHPAQGVFRDRGSITSVLMLVLPMSVAVAALPYIGFYLMTGLYMGFFARAIGHYRWHWVGLIAVGVPTAVYLAFELGFRVGLPKSFLYDVVGF